jgi:hypothetical protein
MRFLYLSTGDTGRLHDRIGIRAVQVGLPRDVCSVLFQRLKSIGFLHIGRVEKPAAAETPSQSGFASIPRPFAADLFNWPQRLSAA